MRRPRINSRDATRRNGAVVLELILALPIAFIALLAIVQFGLLSSNQQRLETASRAGAQVASEIPLPTAGPVPVPVQNAITRELANSGITVGRITLEHNVGSSPPYTLTSGSLNCPPIAVTPPPASRRYVRVTVCVETTQLTPNVLRTYGFDLTGRVSEQSTTLRYKQ